MRLLQLNRIWPLVLNDLSLAVLLRAGIGHSALHDLLQIVLEINVDNHFRWTFCMLIAFFLNIDLKVSIVGHCQSKLISRLQFSNLLSKHCFSDITEIYLV